MEQKGFHIRIAIAASQGWAANSPDHKVAQLSDCSKVSAPPPSPSYEASEVSRTMRYTAAQVSMFCVPASVIVWTIHRHLTIL